MPVFHQVGFIHASETEGNSYLGGKNLTDLL